MSLINRQTGIRIKQQSGQTMVFALVFIAVIIIGLIILFNTGQLTRHKMEVQNAADAAAYSAAILTARELNYMAFSNRAMVANQVTIGQFSAFESWGRKYELGAISGIPFTVGVTSGYAVLYGLLLPLDAAAQGVPVSKIVLKLINIVLKGFDKLNSTVGSAMSGFTLLAQNYIPFLQEVYVWHHQSLRLATLASQMETIPKIIDDNAKGATLSNFGAVATLLSAAEQQYRFLAKASNKMPETKRRFAAFVNDSRGDWTRDRRRTDLGASVEEGFDFTVDLILFEVTIDFEFNFEIGLNDILGGTDLRFLGNGNKEEYGWSSLDTVAGKFALGFELEVEVCIYVPPGCIGEGIGFGIDIPMPFGGASAETVEGKALGKNLKAWKKGVYGGVWDSYNKKITAAEAITHPKAAYTKNKKYKGLPSYVDIDPSHYPAVDAAPVFIISVRKNASILRTSDRIEKDKKLMTGQFDLETKLSGGDNTVEGEPGNIVGKIISQLMDDVKEKALEKMEMGGGIAKPVMQPILDDIEKRFKDKLDGLQDDLNRLLEPANIADKEGGVFALATAEVYFKNPDDTVDADKYHGSTFSPYWQVRLTPVDDNIRYWSVKSQGLVLAGKEAPEKPENDEYTYPLSVMGM